MYKRGSICQHNLLINCNKMLCKIFTFCSPVPSCALICTGFLFTFATELDLLLCCYQYGSTLGLWVWPRLHPHIIYDLYVNRWRCVGFKYHNLDIPCYTFYYATKCAVTINFPTTSNYKRQQRIESFKLFVMHMMGDFVFQTVQGNPRTLPGMLIR